MIGFALRSLWLNRLKGADPRLVEAIQRHRLRKLVHHAVKHSPFYQKKYAGLDLARCPLEDLPTTCKAELMANFDQVVTDPEVRFADLGQFVDNPANEGSLYLDRYVASHTSGSQGQPMLMVQHVRLMRLLFGLQMTRGNNESVGLRAAIRRFRHPARLAIVTLKRGFYPSASAFEFIPPEARRFMKVMWLSQTDPDVIERLNAYRPTALTGYAGVLEELALEAAAGRLRLAPELHQVVNNSEALTDRARARIEAAFGLHVMNNYATGECMFLSNACPTDAGAHVNADWAILEVVDDQYRPVPAGTPGSRVLITNLANHVLPFIRYEVGDVVTMASNPCRCGSRLPRVERIEGRTADTFWIEEDGRYRQLISSVFKNAFDHLRDVREWQAIQIDRNQFRVLLETIPGGSISLEETQAFLNRQLEMYRFLGSVRMDLEIVPRLGPDPKTGKYRRIVSLVGAPADLEQKVRERDDLPRHSADPAQIGVPAPHLATNRAGSRVD